MHRLIISLLIATGLLVALFTVVGADPSIVGGNVAPRQAYMVRVAARSGGVIIDEQSLFAAMMPTYTVEQLSSVIDTSEADWVLTCRHCIDPSTNTGYYMQPANALWVRAGDYSLTDHDGERHLLVTEVATVTDWVRLSLPIYVYQDVVLLRLEQSQRREMSGTQPIIDFVPLARDNPSIGQVCHVYGWGYDGNPIREKYLKVLTETVAYVDKHIETASIPGSYVGPGDSGGPLICNGYVYGLLSTGDKTGSSYTSIPVHYQNIAKVIFSRGEGFTITLIGEKPYTYHIKGSVIADRVVVNHSIDLGGGLVVVDGYITSDTMIDNWSIIGRLGEDKYEIEVREEYKVLFPIVAN